MRYCHAVVLSIATLAAGLCTSGQARADGCTCAATSTLFATGNEPSGNGPTAEINQWNTTGVAIYATAFGSSGTAIVGDAGQSTAGWFSGNVYYTGTLSHSSDANLKKDVRDIPYGLAAALKLHPVTFVWKDDKDAKRHLGLIAQEVQTVVPEIVSEAPNPRPEKPRYLSVADTELVPLLINAIQEQNKLIVAQDARITALEAARRPALAGVLGAGGMGGLGLAAVAVGLVFSRRKRSDARS
jgi:hypothetical protein